MKKIAIAAILPVIALTSCNKEPVQSEKVDLDSTSTNETENISSETNSWVENVELNSWIVSSETSQNWEEVKYFWQNYVLPNGETATLAWKMTVVEWKITSIEFPDVDLESGYPQATFAKAIWEKVIWKELTWLQVDAVSWASLTTMAFNEYLKQFSK